MKRKTHNIFGFAIAFWLSTKILDIEVFYIFMLSLYLSMAINWSIDSIAGHRGGRRTPYTHSLLGSVIMSMAMIIPIISIKYLYEINISIELLANISIIAIAIGLAHLALDMFTADGIYILWPISKLKLSISKARYDDPILNFLAVFISIMILLSVVFNRLWI